MDTRQQLIDDIIEAVQDYWIDNPQLRLGQLLSNISFDLGTDDPFHMADEVLLDRLRELQQTQTELDS